MQLVEQEYFGMANDKAIDCRRSLPSWTLRYHASCEVMRRRKCVAVIARHRVSEDTMDACRVVQLLTVLCAADFAAMKLK
jgi:hypothetical protein